MTGIVITSLGISLIKIGMTDLAGGSGAADFGETGNLTLGLLVVVIIIIMNNINNDWIRLSSIMIGLLAGVGAAILMGKMSLSELSISAAIAVPQPFKYGFDFDLMLFLPLAFLSLIHISEPTRPY